MVLVKAPHPSSALSAVFHFLTLQCSVSLTVGHRLSAGQCKIGKFKEPPFKAPSLTSCYPQDPQAEVFCLFQGPRRKQCKVFEVEAWRMWNSLPGEIPIFKLCLKTWFYKKAFPLHFSQQLFLVYSDTHVKHLVT